MASLLKIAVGQIECEQGDLRVNFDKHLQMIDKARSKGVDLLVFPELSLTDYLPAPDCAALAMPRDGFDLTSLSKRAGGMMISVGFIEHDGDGRFFNAQAILLDGQTLAVHRKLNLPGYGKLREDRVYTQGKRLDLLARPDEWRLATLICADHWNPALPWLAALSGANLLLAPTASARGAVGDGFDNPRGWDINLLHTALTYGLPVVFANHCGTRGEADFWGGSRILDAFGHELARAGSGPELIIAEIDYADGQAARQRLPTVRDSNPGLVQELLADFCLLPDSHLMN